MVNNLHQMFIKSESEEEDESMSTRVSDPSIHDRNY